MLISFEGKFEEYVEIFASTSYLTTLSVVPLPYIYFIQRVVHACRYEKIDVYDLLIVTDPSRLENILFSLVW